MALQYSNKAGGVHVRGWLHAPVRGVLIKEELHETHPLSTLFNRGLSLPSQTSQPTIRHVPLLP